MCICAISALPIDENGSGNRTGACDDDNLLTSFNIKRDFYLDLYTIFNRN